MKNSLKEWEYPNKYKKQGDAKKLTPYRAVMENKIEIQLYMCVAKAKRQRKMRNAFCAVFLYVQK